MSLSASYSAIVAHWQGATAFAANRTAYTHMGGPEFDRPPIPSTSTVTSMTRVAVMTALLWCRFDVRIVRGTERQHGVSPTCPTRHNGYVVRSIYYPLGYGFDFVLTRLDLERKIFHRQNLASGVLQFRDCGAPEHIELPDDMAAGWGRVDLDNSFWSTEVVA